MDLLETRRTRQAQRTLERHYYKFIGSYVKAVYKEIYDEAQTLYNHAKAENPGVKDLTKTAFYLRRVHPDATVPRYYSNRKLKGSSAIHQQYSNTQECRQMVLNIPLLSSPEVTMQQESTTYRESTSQPPEVTMQQESTTYRESTSQPPEVTMQQESTTYRESTSQLPEDDILPLPSEIYKSLLADLQKDPELERILNDFPFDDNITHMDVGEDSDGMNQFVVNDMLWPDEFTPLELEVQTTFDNLQ